MGKGISPSVIQGEIPEQLDYPLVFPLGESEMPGVFGMPGAWAAADAPGIPGACGALGAPGAAGMPGAPGAAGAPGRPEPSSSGSVVRVGGLKHMMASFLERRRRMRADCDGSHAHGSIGWSLTLRRLRL